MDTWKLPARPMRMREMYARLREDEFDAAQESAMYFVGKDGWVRPIRQILMSEDTGDVFFHEQEAS